MINIEKDNLLIIKMPLLQLQYKFNIIAKKIKKIIPFNIPLKLTLWRLQASKVCHLKNENG